MNLNNWDQGVPATVFICVFFPIFLYFTYWLFISGTIGLYRMIKSKKWKFTIGEVIHAEIKFKEFTSNRVENFKFIMEKEYRYTVAGKEYQSKQSLPSDSLYSKGFKPMSQFPEKYEVAPNHVNYLKRETEAKNEIGKQIRVFYDPKKPQNACLIPGVQNEIFLPIFMGFISSCGITYVIYHFTKPLFV